MWSRGVYNHLCIIRRNLFNAGLRHQRPTGIFSNHDYHSIFATEETKNFENVPVGGGQGENYLLHESARSLDRNNMSGQTGNGDLVRGYFFLTSAASLHG